MEVNPLSRQQFIPNYIDIGNEKKTLRDLGWKIAYINKKNSKPDDIKIIWQQPYIIHYCINCNQQRHFLIASCKSVVNKKGILYIDGYFGYCSFCKENKQ